MAKTASKTKTNKRQPAKKSRLSSSRVKKPSVKKTLAKTAKKKTPAKKPVKPSAKAKTAKKPSLKKKPAITKKNRKNRTKKLNIWLGRRTSLTLTFKLSKKKAPVKKRRVSKSKPKRDLSFEKNLFLSIALIAVGILGSVYATSQIFTAPLDDSGSVSALGSLAIPVPSTPTKQFLSESRPARLQISSIEVDTRLIDVAKNPDGTLEVPTDSKVAGWYSLGPTPGEEGPSIIAGHVLDNYGVGVFWRLHEVKKGQVIEVTRADGKVAKFKVDSVKQYPQNKFPTEKVYGNIDYAGLRLITCGGTFNQLTQRYSDNTVVFASYWKLKEDKK